MKIYVITAGEYSAYHIFAVTDDKKSAERLRRGYSGWEEARIEEYETEYPPKDPKEYYCVSVSLSGELLDIDTKYFFENAPEEQKPELNVVDLHDTYFDINVTAKDRSHAEKIAFDKIAEYKYEHPEEVEEAIERQKRWNEWVERQLGNRSMASASFTVYEPDERTRGFGSINER